MATNYSAQAAPNRSAKAVGFAQDAKLAWGSYELTDSLPLVANSIIYMCKIPKGAYITGGRVTGDPIDSSGTSSALATIHVGVDKSVTGIDGTVYGAGSATALLLSSLALGPDAVAVVGYKQTNTRNFPLGNVLITNGPLLTSDDCQVYVTWQTSTLALTTGTLNLFVEYYSVQTS